MLTAAGFLVLMLFLFASGLFASACFGMRPERVFLPALILNALLLYASAAFHWTRPGFYCILGANLLLYVPAVLRMRREGAGTVLRRFLTPGTVFALIFLSVFFLLTLWRKFYSWDEISHWGTAAMLFFRDGKLGCEFGGILSHASYPPGTCVLAMLAHFCFIGVPFSENLVLFGHELLLLGIWLYPLSGLTWKRRYQALIICLAYLGFVPVFLREDFHTLYTDAPLACLFGLCVYEALTLRKANGWDWFSLGLLTAFLFPVRNAGFGYAVMLIVLLAVLLTAGGIRNRRMPGAGAIAGFVWIIVLTAAVKYSWVWMLDWYRTPLKFSETPITAGAVIRAFVTNEPVNTWPAWSVTGAFFLRLTCGYIVVFLFLMYGLSLLKRKSISPERGRSALAGMVFCIVSFTLFLLTTLVYYIFEFNELSPIPSFDRYVSAFFIMPAFVLLFLWNDEYAERAAAEPPETGFGVTTVRRKKILWALAAWCVIATVYNFIPYAAFVWRKCRLECDHVKTDYGDLVSKPGVRFGMLTSTGKGFKNFYGVYLYPDNFVRLEQWDPVLVKKEGDSAWKYVQVTTPEKLRAEFLERKLDYVYLETPRAEFLRDFTDVFEAGTETGPFLAHHLCRVLPDGRLKPVPRPGEVGAE